MTFQVSPRGNTPFLALLIVGLLTLTACQSTPSATETDSDNIEVETSKVTYPSMPAIPSEIQRTTSGSEMMELMAPTFDEIESFYKTWNDLDSVEERDHLARKMLDQHQEREDFFLRSIVAESALIAILQSDASKAHMSSIDLYTNVLIDNDTFNTVLMNDALRTLKGSWSAAKVNASAQQTMDHALEWLERTDGITEKSGLSANSSLQESMSASGHENARKRVQTGIQALSSMVGTS